MMSAMNDVRRPQTALPGKDYSKYINRYQSAKETLKWHAFTIKIRKIRKIIAKRVESPLRPLHDEIGKVSQDTLPVFCVPNYKIFEEKRSASKELPPRALANILSVLMSSATLNLGLACSKAFGELIVNLNKLGWNVDLLKGLSQQTWLAGTVR